MFPQYDVIVVGAGHAGCEAAAAAAKMGSRVLLVTMSMTTIAQMSCNPAMGGIAKGQIIREIDALGGMSGIIADHSMIQFRMLNKSKGPAMWSPRTQNDRMRFSEVWRRTLEAIPNVDFWQEIVKEIIVKNGQVIGVKTSMGLEIRGKAVVLTNGTFLNGMIHIGDKCFGGGRAGEKGSVGLTAQLVSLGFASGRMKTGTSPRIDGRTLNYSKMEEQKGDDKPGKFSFTATAPLQQQQSCYITYTNQKVHQILANSFEKSPLFNGTIQSKGPRYCPSIEDKIKRFPDRERHQIFVEPDGWHTIQIYVNGFATSLPETTQYEALKAIPGFEQVKMFCPGYTIEYDYLPATQLYQTLETRLIKNLYFAGQINGTTGYEEAACQGLMAGINAHRKINSLDPLVLSRSDAYIGVLISDLVTKNTDEPYRMFTSRAECRLLLRQDNADLRLTAIGHQMGLAADQRLEKVYKKQDNIDKLLQAFKTQQVHPVQINKSLEKLGAALCKDKQSIYQLLKRPEITLNTLIQLNMLDRNYLCSYDQDVLEQVELQIKYESYLQKEQVFIDKAKRLENYPIPLDFTYDRLQSLSAEAREKLQKFKPTTIGQASKISGVSPADISILMVYMGR